MRASMWIASLLLDHRAALVAAGVGLAGAALAQPSTGAVQLRELEGAPVARDGHVVLWVDDEGRLRTGALVVATDADLGELGSLAFMDAHAINEDLVTTGAAHLGSAGQPWPRAYIDEVDLREGGNLTSSFPLAWIGDMNTHPVADTHRPSIWWVGNGQRLFLSHTQTGVTPLPDLSVVAGAITATGPLVAQDDLRVGLMTANKLEVVPGSGEVAVTSGGTPGGGLAVNAVVLEVNADVLLDGDLTLLGDFEVAGDLLPHGPLIRDPDTEIWNNDIDLISFGKDDTFAFWGEAGHVRWDSGILRLVFEWGIAGQPMDVGVGELQSQYGVVSHNGVTINRFSGFRHQYFPAAQHVDPRTMYPWEFGYYTGPSVEDMLFISTEFSGSAYINLSPLHPPGSILRRFGIVHDPAGATTTATLRNWSGRSFSPTTVGTVLNSATDNDNIQWSSVFSHTVGVSDRLFLDVTSNTPGDEVRIFGVALEYSRIQF